MPVIKIELVKNNQMDRKCQEKQFCCPVAWIKLKLKPTDTLTRQAAELGVAISTIKNNRKWLREGRLTCKRRNSCMAALWLTPKEFRELKEGKE